MFIQPTSYVQKWAIRWSLGCVNPASWLPLTTWGEFTQPRAHLLAIPVQFGRASMAQILLKPGVAVAGAIFRQSCSLPESVVVGRAEDSAVVAEADLLDEALARVGLLQEVGQPPHVPVDLEPARGVGLVSLD